MAGRGGVVAVVPQLTVRHIEASVKFYEEILGFEATLRDPETDPIFVMLENGEASLYLVSEDSREEIYQLQQLKAGDARGTGVRIYFEVENAEAVYRLAQDRGVPVLRALTYNEREDYTDFSIADPDGYEVGVYS
jgi:catechol 2,3-dioxygenase-like lactoylglutathione lyase family enzyme